MILSAIGLALLFAALCFFGARWIAASIVATLLGLIVIQLAGLPVTALVGIGGFALFACAAYSHDARKTVWVRRGIQWPLSAVSGIIGVSALTVAYAIGGIL